MEEQQEYDPSSKDGSLASRLLRAEAVTGKCYVICFSPSHNLTLADMSPAQIVPIIETCPCGWGFEQPIAVPLFSKICMYRY